MPNFNYFLKFLDFNLGQFLVNLFVFEASLLVILVIFIFRHSMHLFVILLLIIDQFDREEINFVIYNSLFID
jgi:hypothetical protein